MALIESWNFIALENFTIDPPLIQVTARILREVPFSSPDNFVMKMNREIEIEFNN